MKNNEKNEKFSLPIFHFWGFFLVYRFTSHRRKQILEKEVREERKEIKGGEGGNGKGGRKKKSFKEGRVGECPVWDRTTDFPLGKPIP